MADEKKLTVRLVRSAVASVKKDQTLTCRAMGLRRIGDVSELPDNPSVRGMTTAPRATAHPAPTTALREGVPKRFFARSASLSRDASFKSFCN